MYSQRIKKAYSRTPGQLLSLTTQFTFSPVLENKLKPTTTTANKSKNIPIHFSSPNQRDTTLQLPVPFLECSRQEQQSHNVYSNLNGLDTSDSFDNSYHSRGGDSSFRENISLLDVVSTSHPNHHNLSGTLLKSTRLVENAEECNSLSSKKPRLNTTEIVTPFSSGLIEHGTTIGDLPESGDSVWGTPDYLAPEILLRTREGIEVDWWALGVCFYEFLCGFPPFNDDSVEFIFKNIIDRNMAWPPISESCNVEEETATFLNERFNCRACPTPANDDIPTISSSAANIVSKLLHPDPQARADFDAIIKHPYFSGVHWDNIVNSTVPFTPGKCDSTTTAATFLS